MRRLLVHSSDQVEDCTSDVAGLDLLISWRGITHACYQDNRAGTAVVASVLTGHPKTKS
jgi:hypothetical protein